MFYLFYWYHDEWNWYIFSYNWYHKVLFWFHPLLILFLFKTKWGRTLFLLFSLTPLLMIDKKGEKYLSLYACLLFIYMLISKFVSYWYQESLFDVLMFYWYWYQENIFCCFDLLVLIFTIDIKITYMFTSFNWYQNFWLNSSTFILCTFNWYVLFIFNWYHDALNWYFFSIGIIMFWFDFTPYLYFCLRRKGGEHCIIIFFDLFVDDWQKGREVFEFICMFIVYL